MNFTAPLTLHLPLDVDGAGPDAGLADRIDAALPQTQCTRCGYPDCRAYAQAVASGQAAINRCPPGGEAGIARLAALTGRPALPLDAACGAEAPRLLAVIIEADCIGCTLCIKACPVDCILGAPKRMHTVIDDQCTGCELCVPACPVDCIAMVPIHALINAPITAPHTGWATWTAEQAGAARQRYLERQARALRLARETDERLAANAAATTTATATATATAAAKLADLPAHSQHTDPAALARKRAVVDAALARARARQAERDAG